MTAPFDSVCWQHVCHHHASTHPPIPSAFCPSLPDGLIPSSAGLGLPLSSHLWTSLASCSQCVCYQVICWRKTCNATYVVLAELTIQCTVIKILASTKDHIFVSNKCCEWQVHISWHIHARQASWVVHSDLKSIINTCVTPNM